MNKGTAAHNEQILQTQREASQWLVLFYRLRVVTLKEVCTL